MSTLLLTQRFPPHPGAAARRLRYLADRFAAQGEVYVIRSGVPGEEVPSVTETISVRGKDLRQLTGREGKTISTKKKRSPAFRYLLNMRQAFPFVYLTDDGGADYRQKAFATACQIVETKEITTIFSSFRPWSDHLVAKRLKKKYPHLRWLADFRDLPVDPVRQDIWWPGLQTWWGKQVIASADEVWAVSAGQRAQLTGWHPNIIVRRNPLLALPPAENNPITAHFSIVYTGSLYPGLQNVEPLVTALRSLIAAREVDPDKLRLVYRGKDAELFREWMSGLPATSLAILSSIAPAAAQKMQREAQVLLLLNWSAPNYYGVLTAKLWDYLATGRPVLALVNGPDDPELRQIIEDADAGVVFATDEAGLQTWLRNAYRQWATTGQFSWSVYAEDLSRYL